MTKEVTIPLAKHLDMSKLDSGVVYISEKLDGVPARVDITLTGSGYDFNVRSRPGLPIVSVDKQMDKLCADLHRAGVVGQHTFIGELTHKSVMVDGQRTRLPFKIVSGKVRAERPCDELTFNLFEYTRSDADGAHRWSFSMRWSILMTLAQHLDMKEGWTAPVRQMRIAEDKRHLLQHILDELHQRMPFAEGFVVRHSNDLFVPGKRSWGYQKVVRAPMTDLWIRGAEEATSKDGEPLGMVGRLHAEFRGQLIGVGPGKLTHTERRELFEAIKAGGYAPRLAQIRYKKDGSYDAMREPTFQHWRDDKDEANEETA